MCLANLYWQTDSSTTWTSKDMWIPMSGLRVFSILGVSSGQAWEGNWVQNLGDDLPPCGRWSIWPAVMAVCRVFIGGWGGAIGFSFGLERVVSGLTQGSYGKGWAEERSQFACLMAWCRCVWTGHEARGLALSLVSAVLLKSLWGRCYIHSCFIQRKLKSGEMKRLILVTEIATNGAQIWTLAIGLQVPLVGGG